MVPEENQPVAPPGPPANRAELERALDSAGAMPAGPAWKMALDGYLTWNPTCPLGLAAYSHVLAAEGNTDEAQSLYQSAIKAEPDLFLPEPGYSEPEPEPESENSAGPPPQKEEAEEDPHRKEKITSLIVAVAVHIVLIVVFSVWAVTKPRVRPPQIVALAAPDAESEAPERERLKKSVSSPASVEASQVDVVSSVSFAPVTLPTVMTDSLNPAPAAMGAAFGPSLDFGSGGTGEIAFFGSKAKAQKLVYVVDVSGSMNYGGDGTKNREQLMKEELTRSILALPPGTLYQIIFFSSHAWFAGKKTNETEFRAKYGDNPDPAMLPTESLIRAIPSRQRATARQIEQTEPGGGTNWRLPLKMAIKLEPNVIFFLTDGEIDSDSGDKPVIDDVVDYNASMSRAKINTICLMELNAYDELKELADRTRGDVFLVKEDGTVAKGLELNNLR